MEETKLSLVNEEKTSEIDHILSHLRTHDSSYNETLVRKAINYTIQHHGDQQRESGEPYYYHPIAVASIVASMKLDHISVIVALLHDVIEDTNITLDEIEKEFGSIVAKLVDGITKLTKISFKPEHVRQAENFQKFLLAISDDIRVLLIKLADRLHNMRTINFVKSIEKRKRMALETIEIYAPLSERIGMQHLKLELQDTSFQVLNPDIRELITTKLNKLKVSEEETINTIISTIQQDLEGSGMTNIKVFGRQKSPYSIWMKMTQKNVSFDQLSDLIAFRVIVNTQMECYQALGIIHSRYKNIPESFHDFISTSKQNGYQSLHTVVIGPTNEKIEIQIRTQAMHEIAEYGVAAHWCYKQKYKSPDSKKYRWVQELLKILEQTEDVEEFIQNTKLSMYYDQVFCFTPKGNMVVLPIGATTIDFAYAVHSEVGHHAVGAKINDKTVPLRSKLKNGDIVQITTSKKQTPSPTWEKFVVTGKARSEIRRCIRQQQKSQYIILGKALIERAFKQYNITDYDKTLQTLVKSLNCNSIEELHSGIGGGTIPHEEFTKLIKPESKLFGSTLEFFKPKKRPSVETIPIKDLIPGIVLHYAGCCYPLFGDPIVGVIHTGRGITIHTSDCHMLSNFSTTPDRIIRLAWDADISKIPHISRIKVIINNITGSLAELSSTIAKYKSNITNFKILSRNEDFFEVLFDVEVTGVDQLENIINILKTKDNIFSVERYKA